MDEDKYNIYSIYAKMVERLVRSRKDKTITDEDMSCISFSKTSDILNEVRTDITFRSTKYEDK